jgi:hypothetical protein
VFHCKFQEELEKGATDRLRLQELLHLEKLKLEKTESELREVRRKSPHSAAVETRLDGLSLNNGAPQSFGGVHNDACWKLMAESERRIAAESKASYFEESAKVSRNSSLSYSCLPSFGFISKTRTLTLRHLTSNGDVRNKSRQRAILVYCLWKG